MPNREKTKRQKERGGSKEERLADVHFHLNKQKNLKWSTLVIISTWKDQRVLQNNNFWKCFTSLFSIQLRGRRHVGIKWNSVYDLWQKLPELISVSDHFTEKIEVEFSFFLRSSHGPVSQLYFIFYFVFQISCRNMSASKAVQKLYPEKWSSGAFVQK